MPTVLQVSRAAPAPAAATVSQQEAFSAPPSLAVFTQGSSRLADSSHGICHLVAAMTTVRHSIVEAVMIIIYIR